MHVEDAPLDALVVSRLLETSGVKADYYRVQNRNELLQALRARRYELVFADYRLPDLTGMEVLQQTRAVDPDVPFVFVTGTIDEDTAVASLTWGVTDYVLKGNLARLAAVVRRALAEGERRSLLKSMEERLRRAERMEAAGTLAAGLAHDLNNLLAVVSGQFDLIGAAAAKGSSVAEWVRRGRRAVERGSWLAGQLLTFARQDEIRLEPVLAHACLAETVELLRDTLPPGVELATRFEAGDVIISADPGQLDRILTNLVRNACDALPQGGRITISTELLRADERPSMPASAHGEGWFRVSVADTGVGMDEEMARRAFEPFVTTKMPGKGTGLGLAVVHGLMRQHHGFASIETSPGEGATVLLHFPLPAGTAAALAPVTVGQRADLILVVDDDEEVRLFLETVLQVDGFTTVSTQGADGALAVLAEAEGAVSLVITDLQFGAEDGLALAARIKGIHPDMPVIVISREHPPRERITAADAFIAKPYQTGDLLRKVRALVERGRQPLAAGHPELRKSFR